MPSAELISTQVPKEPAAAPNTPPPRSPHTVVSREATARRTAKRSRGPAAFRAIGLWLLRVLTDSAGAWALAAGAPLDPANAAALAGGIVAAIDPTCTEAERHGGPGRSGPAR